ncbi:MAG: RluA family pseudouridine synthase [bacterium]
MKPKFPPSNPLPDPRTFTSLVESVHAGQRADVFLSAQLPGFSRSRIKSLIDAGAVTIAGSAAKPSTRLRAGERIVVELPEPAPEELVAEAVPLDVIFEDEDLLVINKPPGLAVHPGAGRSGGTLANALIARLPSMRGVGPAQRPGIVHRLDRDTSGLMVVAKHAVALDALQRAVAAREVTRRYLALLSGRLSRDEGTIDAPIGRHPRHRTKMAVVTDGRTAVTRYRVVERLEGATLVEARLVTGRTHQIRVHFAHLGYPVVGDRVYGGRRGPPGGLTAARQMLHAYRLAFRHPTSGAPLEFSSPLPEDFARVLASLRLPRGAERRGGAEGSSGPARKPRPVRTRQNRRRNREA